MLSSQPPLAPRARLALPKGLLSILAPLVERAKACDAQIYLVGGCVRDFLLGRPAVDIDVVVEGPSLPIARAAARSSKAKLISHPQFLTNTLEFKNGRRLDIATARTETYAEPAALPVVEPASLQEDLYRRDFSINAIAISLNEQDLGHVWDPFGGMEDLRAKKIRVLHAQSFKDDPTRIFRAARFAGRFGYDLEWRTREWLNESIGLQLPGTLSGARLREELIPLLQEKDPRPPLRLLSQWGALSFLVPHLKWERSHETFFGQLIKQQDQTHALQMRLLVLVHTLPYAKAVGSLGHLMFSQQTMEQVELALTLLARLREGTLSMSDVKKRSRQPLPPEVRSFVTKALKVKSLTKRKSATLDWQRFEDSAPTLTGQDVRDLGYKPGPVYTKIFEALRQARWEGKLRTREEEIRFIQYEFPLQNGH